MKGTLKQILIVLLLGIATAQFRSELPIQSLPTNLNGELDNQRSLSLFDPGRLDMSHGFSMSMLSNGLHSFSVMGFTNNLNYLLADNLMLDANLTLYSSQLQFQQGQAFNQLNIAYDAGITYQPTKNSYLQLRFQRSPHNQRYQSRSPFNMRFIQ